MNGVNGLKLGRLAAKPNLCKSNAEARFKNYVICFIVRKLILNFAMLRGLSPSARHFEKRLSDASVLTFQELRNFPNSLCQNWSSGRCHVGYVNLSAVGCSLRLWGTAHRAYTYIFCVGLCVVPFLTKTGNAKASGRGNGQQAWLHAFFIPQMHYPTLKNIQNERVH